MLPQSIFADQVSYVLPFGVSDVTSSTESELRSVACVFVAAPLMPLVTFVELPLQNADLSTALTVVFQHGVRGRHDVKSPPTTVSCFVVSPDRTLRFVADTLPPSIAFAACLPAARPNTTVEQLVIAKAVVTKDAHNTSSLHGPCSACGAR